MSLTLTKNLPPVNRPPTVSLEFVDATARDAETYTSFDISRIAKLDDGTFWVLKSVGPDVWEEIFIAPGVGPTGATGPTGPTGNIGPTGSPGPAGPGYYATSTTSLLIEVASKTFTTQSDLAYSVGARVRASSAADTANYMEGLVTSYSGTTLIISIDHISGSGTYADWDINLAGDIGPTGATGATGATGSSGGGSIIYADADNTVIGVSGTYTDLVPVKAFTISSGDQIRFKLIIAVFNNSGSSRGLTFQVTLGSLVCTYIDPLLFNSNLSSKTVFEMDCSFSISSTSETRAMIITRQAQGVTASGTVSTAFSNYGAHYEDTGDNTGSKNMLVQVKCTTAFSFNIILHDFVIEQIPKI